MIVATYNGVRVRCYIEDNGIRIHRMDDAVYQTCGFAQGRWVYSTEILDMFIGELWADEVSEVETNSVTPRASAESTPCDNGIDSSGQKSMPAAKGASQSLHRDPECRRITGKDGGMEMGARRSGSRIFIVMLAILAFTLIVVGTVLIATGRLCITSSHRPVDRYEGASGAGEAGLSADLAAILAFTLIVVGTVLIATGRLCITSSHRPVDRYEGASGAGEAGLSADLAAMVDADSDGIADNDDVLAAALAYIQTRPHYKSVYYPSGYPDDEHGVCTDVVAIACREAGYDLQALVAADVARRPGYPDDEHGVCTDVVAIACREAGYDLQALVAADVARRPEAYAIEIPDPVCTDVVAIACREAGYDLQALVAADVARRPEAYAIEIPDPAIDFRRTPNLRVFFDAHAQRLTSDARNISEWRGGDIVLYEGHIGIVSDRRNERGVPYLIHQSGPLQLRYEEDKLQSYGHIVGHYRLNPTCRALLS